MLIIPAVDIREGRCVRLVHGDPARETVYHEDPVEAARRWEAEGAGRLHLVDLDGAFAGKMKNAGVIEKIVKTVSVPVQVGGGIRSIEAAADLLDRGVSRVIIGTAAVTNPEIVAELCRQYPGRIIVGIDARGGRVAIRGWQEDTPLAAESLAQQMWDLGVKEIIYTDIKRDGTLQGPNIEALRELATAVPQSIIASGGVSGPEDIRRLLPLKPLGVSGVIAGQALYTERLALREALRIAGGMPDDSQKNNSLS
jgi:phosphoribosylformimino-5-aminoimidazole carboxamide ribotide isomerase